MEEAIIWAVVWGALAFLTSGLVGWLVAGAISFLAFTFDWDWLVLVGVLVGWIAGITWFVLCAVNSVQSILTAVNLS